MPIQGIIEVWKITPYLKFLEQGAGGYIDTFEIIVTPLATFVSIYGVIYKEEVSDDMVFIKRIGPGLTAADFDLDFTKTSYSPLLLATEATYFEILLHKEKFLIFPKEEFEINTTFVKDVTKENKTPTKEDILFSLEQARLDLDQALLKEDYETSAILREQIAEYEKILSEIK